MTFTHPWVLLLLAVPVLLAWTVAARPPGITLPVDFAERPRRRLAGFVLGVADAVPLAALALAIVMLAGPQTLQQTRRERQLTNIQICMDVSGSMSGDPYRRAAEAITDFTKRREGDAFGLMIFGSAQMRWVPLTRDLSAVRQAMPFANPANQPSHMGGTMIGAALRYARDLFEADAAPGDRMIILVSDGDSFDLGGGTETEVAQELQDAGITLYHIHVSQDDIPDSVVEIARATGGQALAAADDGTMRQVFEHIDRMKPAVFKPAGTAPLDFFGPFAIAAACLAALHSLSLLGARYTPW